MWKLWFNNLYFQKGCFCLLFSVVSSLMVPLSSQPQDQLSASCPLPSCLLVQLSMESNQYSLSADSSYQYFLGHGKQITEYGVQWSTVT